MGDRGSNLERLLEGGVIDPEVVDLEADEPLPVPYLRFVEGLTEEEVDLLIAMRNRLVAADEWQTSLTGEAVMLVRPPY